MEESEYRSFYSKDQSISVSKLFRSNFTTKVSLLHFILFLTDECVCMCVCIYICVHVCVLCVYMCVHL